MSKPARGKFLLCAFAAVSACHAVAPPPDCRLVARQAPKCLLSHRRADERALLLGCFPFSAPETITGAWVHGFETNEFYERVPASARLADRRGSDTALETEAERPDDERIRVWQVTLVGRRSQCDMGLPPKVIVVDRIVASKVVEVPR
ncbi:MAG: hypothetical protein ACJ8DZ_02945 [Allosphingosinicella sp.]